MESLILMVQVEGGCQYNDESFLLPRIIQENIQTFHKEIIMTFSKLSYHVTYSLSKINEMNCLLRNPLLHVNICTDVPS
jgi:hypothetical protein